MENCVASSSLGVGPTLSPGASCKSLSGSMVIELVSPVAEAEIAAAMMSAWMVRTLHARLDQVGAKLIEEQEADHEHHEAAKIEDDDPAGE